MTSVVPPPAALEPWIGDVTKTCGFIYPRAVEVLKTREYSREEIVLVYDTLAIVRPDFICEWGTNVGHSARIFHDAAALLQLDCQIHSVEISEKIAGGRGHMVAGLDVTLHVGDGLTIGLILYRRGGIKRPLFFLDDSHAYAGVLTQLEAIADEAPHAAMLVHDVFTVDTMSQLMLHEPGLAVRDFTRRDRYHVTSVYNDGSMLRLLPR